MIMMYMDYICFEGVFVTTFDLSQLALNQITAGRTKKKKKTVVQSEDFFMLANTITSALFRSYLDYDVYGLYLF